MWQFWLLLAGFFLIVEIISVGFLVFWFAVGALITMIVSLFCSNIIVQATVFLIASVILLFATRPFVEKVCRKDETVKTNVYSVEGKIGKVVENIDPNEAKGQVKVNGELWSASSYNDLPITKDTEVIIEKINGVKLIVKPLINNKEEKLC